MSVTPAAIAASTSAAGLVLLTAISAPPRGSRPARCAARGDARAHRRDVGGDVDHAHARAASLGRQQTVTSEQRAHLVDRQADDVAVRAAPRARRTAPPRPGSRRRRPCRPARRWRRRRRSPRRRAAGTGPGCVTSSSSAQPAAGREQRHGGHHLVGAAGQTVAACGARRRRRPACRESHSSTTTTVSAASTHSPAAGSRDRRALLARRAPRKAPPPTHPAPAPPARRWRARRTRRRARAAAAARRGEAEAEDEHAGHRAVSSPRCRSSTEVNRGGVIDAHRAERRRPPLQCGRAMVEMPACADGRWRGGACSWWRAARRAPSGRAAPRPGGTGGAPAAVESRRAAFGRRPARPRRGRLLARRRRRFAPCCRSIPSWPTTASPVLARSCRRRGGDSASCGTYWQRLLDRAAAEHPHPARAARARPPAARRRRSRRRRALLASRPVSARSATCPRGAARARRHRDARAATRRPPTPICPPRRRAAPGTALGARGEAAPAGAPRNALPRWSRAARRSKPRCDCSCSERDFAAARAAAERLLATAPSAERPAILRLRADAEHGAGELEPGLATLQEIVARYPASPAAPRPSSATPHCSGTATATTRRRKRFTELRARYPRMHASPKRSTRWRASPRVRTTTPRRSASTPSWRAPSRPMLWLTKRAGASAGSAIEQGRWREAAAAFAAAAAGRAAPQRRGGRLLAGARLEQAGDAADAARIYRRIARRRAGELLRLLGGAPAGRGSADRSVEAGRAPRTGPPRIGAAPAPIPITGCAHASCRRADLPNAARRELRAFERANARRGRRRPAGGLPGRRRLPRGDPRRQRRRRSRPGDPLPTGLLAAGLRAGHGPAPRSTAASWR